MHAALHVLVDDADAMLRRVRPAEPFRGHQQTHVRQRQLFGARGRRPAGAHDFRACAGTAAADARLVLGRLVLARHVPGDGLRELDDPLGGRPDATQPARRPKVRLRRAGAARTAARVAEAAPFEALVRREILAGDDAQPRTRQLFDVRTGFVLFRSALLADGIFRLDHLLKLRGIYMFFKIFYVFNLFL